MGNSNSAPKPPRRDARTPKFRFSPGRQSDFRVPERDDPMFTDRAGRTALHYAVIDAPVGLNHTAALKDDVLRKANFNASNAFRMENTTRLLELGADVNATDNVGLTPLHVAAQSDSLDVIHLLITAGADVNATSEDGRTPIHRAVRNTTRARLALVEALLVHGADPTIDAHVGQFLSIIGDTQMTALCAEHGYDLTPRPGD